MYHESSFGKLDFSPTTNLAEFSVTCTKYYLNSVKWCVYILRFLFNIHWSKGQTLTFKVIFAWCLSKLLSNFDRSQLWTLTFGSHQAQTQWQVSSSKLNTFFCSSLAFDLHKHTSKFHRFESPFHNWTLKAEKLTEYAKNLYVKENGRVICQWLWLSTSLNLIRLNVLDGLVWNAKHYPKLLSYLNSVLL